MKGPALYMTCNHALKCLTMVVLLCLAGFYLRAQTSKPIFAKTYLKYLRQTEHKNKKFLHQQISDTKKLINQLQSQLIKHKTSSTYSLVTIQLNNASNRLQNIGGSQDTLLISDPAKVYLNISKNLESGIQAYLKHQVILIAYLNEQPNALPLNMDTERNAALSAVFSLNQQLDSLNCIQQSVLKIASVINADSSESKLSKYNLKKLEKKLYYFNQRQNGFNQLYTSELSGTEKKLNSLLNFSSPFNAYASNFQALNHLPGNNMPQGALNLSGFQTLPAISAKLPINTPGLPDLEKLNLLNNYRNSIRQFSKVQMEQPNLHAFKEKPSFKPNPYKKLPLKMRLIPGYNVQFTPKTTGTPMLAHLGFSLGYKWRPVLTPILGASYNLGLSLNREDKWLNNSYTLRGGFEYKLIYGFSLQLTYQQTRYFKPSLNQTKPALLLGLIHKHQISRKHCSTFFAGYDFLYKQQQPYSPPFIFRVGYE